MKKVMKASYPCIAALCLPLAMLSPHAQAEVRDMVQDKVQALLQKMTLEEKLGQLTQYSFYITSIFFALFTSHFLSFYYQIVRNLNCLSINSFC